MKQQDKSVFDEYKNYLEEKDIDIGKNTEEKKEKALQFESEEMVLEEFKNTDWDAYRNNSIGFIFQSYNLINHLDIISNVEMGMTLSGVSAKEKKEKALQALERVGLKEHVHCICLKYRYNRYSSNT